jgi:hypothetical protein
MATDKNLNVRLKRFGVKACVSIVLGVLLLSSGEFTAYIYLRLNPPPPVYSNSYFHSDYAREINRSAEQQYLPWVIWRRKPYHGRFISVDEQGVRVTVNSDCGDSKNDVIWMFGDSALWGSGSTDAETIPSQLARLYAHSGKKICVRNYAEAGWTSTQEVIELMLQLKRASRKPDMVMFYDGTEDVFVRYQSDIPDAHQNFALYKQQFDEWHPAKNWGFSYFRLTNTYRALHDLARKVAFHERLGARHDLAPDDLTSKARSVVENHAENMHLVDALASYYGFRDLFLWYPTSLVGQKPLTAPERQEVRALAEANPGLDLLSRETYRMCQATKMANFIYLGDILDKHPERLYIDSSHLTPEGNGLVAQRLFEVLQTAKVVRQ